LIQELTYGQKGKTLNPRARVVEAEPRQVSGQVRALESRLDLGVNEADHLGAVVVAEPVVDKPGQFAAHVHLVP
jgi:hypothetical protein